MDPLIRLSGREDLLFVAPHAPAPLTAAEAFVTDEPAIRAELADRVADWHDLGTDAALAAAVERAGCQGLRPTVPRAVVDLNRGWRGRAEQAETLFGKGAIDGWVRGNLVDGAEAALERYWRGAIAGIREASRSARAVIELHSYGDLGSTYDRLAGGRPMVRSEAAVVHGAPWATAFPIGLSRLIPANLRGASFGTEVRVGEALAAHRIRLGPSPYPAQLPWTVSARFLADRWFRWLGRTGRLPAEVADRLADLTWTDELAPEVDAVVAAGSDDGDWPGVAALAARIGAWSHDGAALVEAFAVEDGSYTVGVELRIDLKDRGAEFGAAVADAVAPENSSRAL
ncbi:MAG: hypothetical protein ABMB14_26045 [Myxococcota bacterium]